MKAASQLLSTPPLMHKSSNVSEHFSRNKQANVNDVALEYLHVFSNPCEI